MHSSSPRATNESVRTASHGRSSSVRWCGAEDEEEDDDEEEIEEEENDADADADADNEDEEDEEEEGKTDHTQFGTHEWLKKGARRKRPLPTTAASTGSTGEGRGGGGVRDAHETGWDEEEE